jgi:hypothetical protein
MQELLIKVYEIAVDGLPDMEHVGMTGRVAFIWNGAICSGWPLDKIGKPGLWESSEDAMGLKPFSGITHWVELPVAAWDLERVQVSSPALNTDKEGEQPTNKEKN